ncbi:hypothetical protein RHOER0001_4623 [Rhodococcus erythropolis SK121]|nr:hypothetical protein RHOER0001_4623 [Rhodococcus erythropolis SK121]
MWSARFSVGKCDGELVEVAFDLDADDVVARRCVRPSTCWAPMRPPGLR